MTQTASHQTQPDDSLPPSTLAADRLGEGNEPFGESSDCGTPSIENSNLEHPEKLAANDLLAGDWETREDNNPREESHPQLNPPAELAEADPLPPAKASETLAGRDLLGPKRAMAFDPVPSIILPPAPTLPPAKEAIAFDPVPSISSPPTPLASVSQPVSLAAARHPESQPAAPVRIATSQATANGWQKLNLIQKAVLAAVLLGAVPSLVLGGISYSTFNGAVRQQVREIVREKDLPLGDREIERLSSPQLPWQFLLSAITTAGLTGTLAAFLTSRAMRPLSQIAQAVQKIERGDLDARVNLTGEGEFAVVGRQIDTMTRQIQHLAREQALNLERVTLLAEVASSSASDRQSLAATIDRALDRARQILQADRVLIYRFNPDYSGAVAYESLESGMKSALKEKIGNSCIPAATIDAYCQGKIVANDEVRKADLHPDHLRLMARLEVQSNLVVPILNQGGVYGLLAVHHCARVHHWQEGESQFLRQLAAQLGITLDRISLQEQRRDDAKRSQKLKDITLAIAAALDSDGVFDVAVREVRRALESDRAIVYRFNPDWSGRIIAESVLGPYPKALGADISDPCFAQRYVDKYKRGRVQATANIYDAGLTDCHLKQLEPFAVKANLVAPILYKDELLGLLIAHQCSGTRVWERGEIDFFAQIATQVGFFLERTALLERQRLAEEEQRTARETLQKRALDLLEEVDPVSRGDLTIRARVTEDEIGTIADSYNATIESLRRIVSQVQTAAGQLAFTTGNNETAVRQLSEEAQIQAKDAAIALDRIQSMTSSILAVASNAERAEIAVLQATQTVEAGEEAMNRTVDGIMAIRGTVAETAKKVKRLGESSQKISKVVNLIGSFADQTNLLALNASIEAAHAGEGGRGFAVVADEVRSLARQSAEATAEIESLVATIQAETNEVVAAMESGTEQVVVGTKLVDETRKSLNQITAASAQITELVEAIAKAASEQAQTSQDVSQTMAQVASTSDKTSQEAEQVSESFKHLLAVAQSLQQSVRQFKVQ